MQHKGFFGLHSPVDLLSKIGHDYERMKAAPTDSYAAFDFFVTASHMHEWWQRYGVEWIPPTDAKERAILRLCGEIGNGAKHFVMEHKDIIGHEITWNAEFSGNLALGTMILHLEENDATLFGVTTITVLQLAASVLQYWSGYEHRRRFPLSFT
jgi:hypothetical protein